MKKPHINLTQDLAGYSYFENFLISTITTILLVRFYLHLTNYPQIGVGGLHIAHMLWGGLILMVALLMTLMFLDRWIRASTAVLGGIGFGLFIDELGKFITSDNNYFFEPTIALLYIIFILLYLLLLFIKKYMHITSSEYLSNAIDLFRDGITNGLSPQSNQKLIEYLKMAGNQFTLSTLSSVMSIRLPSKKSNFAPFEKIKQRYTDLFQKTVKSTVFQKIVISAIVIKGFLTAFLVINIILFVTGVRPDISVLSTGIVLSFESMGLTISTLIAGILAIGGLISYPISRRRAFLFFRYYLLFSIFIVQFFLFWADQFEALSGLLFDIIALQAVNIILSDS